tara:strand:+ start:16452 stop:16922 length:471 start_codon:yes stop_codon:yes gene_type:complete
MDPYIKKYTDYLRYISGIEDDILNSNNELIDREDLDTDNISSESAKQSKYTSLYTIMINDNFLQDNVDKVFVYDMVQIQGDSKSLIYGAHFKDQDVRVFGMMRPAFSLAEVEYINEDHITATSLHLHSNKKEGIVEFKKLLTKYSHDSEEAEKFGF